MLESTHLTKSFGKMKALDGVSVRMNAGQAISLVGPNGSGKTTFLKCLLGLVIPDSGDIVLNGAHILGGWDYRRHIGYMPQIGRYPDNMRVGQVFDMVKEIRRGAFEHLDDDLMRAFEVEKFANKTMRTLSGGTRQKVSACLAFLFDPAVLILDEPTAGLDPVSSEILKEKVLSEKAKGKLILVTSHILSDLDELTTDVMYIIEGKLQFYQPIEQLKARTGEEKLNRALAQVMKQNAAA
ncbi:MAG: ABC transporter ATP-binding protein [Haliscomenobacteraceae bacterium CHB4]|nr:ABC transporter ATP-binding protein [Haliscomenobacteraceae bacterium CHB4]